MTSFADQVNAFRRRLIVSELALRRGNLSATARSLRLSRHALYRWTELLDIPYDAHRHWGGRRPGAGRRAMPDGVGGDNGC